MGHIQPKLSSKDQVDGKLLCKVSKIEKCFCGIIVNFYLFVENKVERLEKPQPVDIPSIVL